MDTFLNVFVDESIHVRGDFIVVAAVCAHADVQQEVVQALHDCGFDPARDEFKSSMRMHGNPAGQELRQRLQIILNDCKIGVAICPTSERAKIVTHVAALLSKLDIPPRTHIAAVHLDEGMRPANAKMPADATVKLGCDSRLVTGIQLADCAAHLISTMLLEELGLMSKTVPASSVYEEQEGEIALAWTLWATVRYALSGRKSVGESDECGLPDPTMNPFGLVVSDACSDAVKAAVEKRLSTVWVGCIH
ncbi:hypothetical protein [Sinorhizobium mexicanum]|uniref:Uncharacterized protein n=1 Tax=Sinorhizobium mexicanum TaxID=375549 RepID=A0A859QKX8_9HYPH|nr:hypothetical protein [Sinorhizobium mexicanum]MBP1886477.1 hypothetical protein [Sinorhizobium mexicanum]QLL63945.1 hypothetical protein FKV68_20900 [Sinorhizobium mexicanum]